jgi:mRNA-degrading endonuclease toxin of MazEF toxin-antitoxin module
VRRAPKALPKAGVANLDTITTISRRTLIERLGPLLPDKLAAVTRAVLFALSLLHRSVWHCAASRRRPRR